MAKSSLFAVFYYHIYKNSIILYANYQNKIYLETKINIQTNKQTKK